MNANEMVAQWVDKAEGDYETVLLLMKNRNKRKRYIIAFHCQQCIEKYLKALMVFYKIRFPKQHDLEALLSMILERDSLLAPLRGDLKFLTPFAVEFRYPGEEITPEEIKKAVVITKRLRKILRKRLNLK